MKPEESLIDIHPIDMLIDLVVNEELDPWDIDIEEVAHKFLEEINKMQKINLRLSGKTLLTSSILLRMKSEDLIPPPEEYVEEIEDFDWDTEYIDFDTLQTMGIPMQRRTQQTTSLFDLVNALQKALNEETLRKNFPKRERVKRKLILQVDEEDFKERIDATYARIKNLAVHGDILHLSDILNGEKDNRTRFVEVILTLLYLDSQHKIKIWQEKLFGEIFIALSSTASN
ncbi:MAG: segregation/condensation protein A [Candidatus Hydrothermarchaeales archaeon]